MKIGRRKYQNKLKAFTLVEVLIGMLLLGVIASISFSAITGLQANLIQFQSKSENLNEIVQLREVIKKDFNSSSEILRTNRGFIAKTLKGSIEYVHNGDKLVRIKDNIESEFSLKLSDLKTFYQEEIQLIPEQPIDAIHIEFESKTPLKIYLKKRKSLAEKINEKIFQDGN